MNSNNIIRLNLLPSELKRRRKGSFIDKVLIYEILIIIVIIVFLYYINLSQKSHIKTLNQNITSTKAEISRYEKELKLVKEAEKLKEQIQQRMVAIQKLEVQRPLWVKTLEEFARVLPNNLWYNQIRYNSTDDRIQLEGESYSLKDIAQLMINLVDSRFYSNTSLDIVQKSGKSGDPYKFKVKMMLIKKTTEQDAGEFKISSQRKPKKKKESVSLKAKGKEALGVDKAKAQKAMEGLKN